MARTNKVGVDYFSFDVDFFDDDKIQLIESEFGMKGGYIAIRLLCKIYKGGYYYKWGTDECLLFTRALGIEGVSKGTVDEIISGLIRRRFFDKGCYDKFGILTSKGIQQRYFEATKRYGETTYIKEYLLNDNIKGKNVNIISINDNTSTQKKRKEKKGKENNPKGYEDFAFEFLEEDYKESFLMWLEYKYQRRETYKTQKSLELCYKQLKEKSSNNSMVATQIIESSMGNNYSGLFELKEKKGGINEKSTQETRSATGFTVVG